MQNLEVSPKKKQLLDGIEVVESNNSIQLINIIISYHKLIFVNFELVLSHSTVKPRKKIGCQILLKKYFVGKIQEREEKFLKSFNSEYHISV